MCLTGEEDIKDKEDIKGPEKRYLSESRHAVTNRGRNMAEIPPVRGTSVQCVQIM